MLLVAEVLVLVQRELVQLVQQRLEPVLEQEPELLGQEPVQGPVQQL